MALIYKCKVETKHDQFKMWLLGLAYIIYGLVLFLSLGYLSSDIHTKYIFSDYFQGDD